MCIYLLFQGLIETFNRNLRAFFVAAAAAELLGGSKENTDERQGGTPHATPLCVNLCVCLFALS